MLTFPCPSCQAKLQVADEHAGKTVKCPTCQATATVPQPAQATDAITTAPAASSPAPETTAVTTPENAAASKPRKDRDDDDRDRGDDRPRRREHSSSGSGAAVAAGMGAGMIVMIILAVFGVLGCCIVAPITIALLVPATQKVREAAARTQSINNLKHISLAFHGFHDANKRLPFNGSDLPVNESQYSAKAKANENRSGSWAFQILPFIEQAPMFNNIDRGRPVITYMCPGRTRPMVETSNGGGAWTDYFYNNYLNSDNASKPDNPDKRMTMGRIMDGTSNTVFVGHGNINMTQYTLAGDVTLSTNIFTGGTTGTMRAGNDGGTSPTGVFLQRDSDKAPGIGNWGGPFPQGGLMGMGDGSVRMLPYTVQNFGEFLTPAGGEVVNIPDF